LFWSTESFVFWFCLGQKKGQKKLQISLRVGKKGLYICSRLEKQRSQQQIEKKRKSQVGLYIARFESLNFSNTIHSSLWEDARKGRWDTFIDILN